MTSLDAKLMPPVVWDRQSYYANSNAKADCACDDHNVLCYVQAAYKACSELETIPPLRKKLKLDDLMALGSKAWFSDDRRVAVIKVRPQWATGPSVLENRFVIYARTDEDWKAGETRYHAATIGGTEQEIGEVWFLVAKEAARMKAVKELAERNAA